MRQDEPKAPRWRGGPSKCHKGSSLCAGSEGKGYNGSSAEESEPAQDWKERLDRLQERFPMLSSGLGLALAAASETMLMFVLSYAYALFRDEHTDQLLQTSSSC